MKRFTETNKWRDPWFRTLPPNLKLFWVYLCDECDNAGFWEPDMDLARFMLGAPLDESETLKAFDGRVEVMESGKWRLTKFIQFQFGPLRDTNPCHKGVLKILTERGYQGAQLNLFRGLLAPQDKEKEKESTKGSVRGVAEDIYAIYPRKVGKPVALRAINRAIAVFGFEAVLEKTRAYAAAVNGKDPQFIPHPSTWFNQERFNDSPETWKQNGSKPAQSISELKAVLLSKQSIETELREKYATQGPLGLDWRDKAKQAQWKGLRHEIRELNQRISTMA